MAELDLDETELAAGAAVATDMAREMWAHRNRDQLGAAA